MGLAGNLHYFAQIDILLPLHFSRKAPTARVSRDGTDRRRTWGRKEKKYVRKKHTRRSSGEGCRSGPFTKQCPIISSSCRFCVKAESLGSRRAGSLTTCSRRSRMLMSPGLVRMPALGPLASNGTGRWPVRAITDPRPQMSDLAEYGAPFIRSGAI